MIDVYNDTTLSTGTSVNIQKRLWGYCNQGGTMLSSPNCGKCGFVQKIMEGGLWGVAQVDEEFEEELMGQ